MPEHFTRISPKRYLMSDIFSIIIINLAGLGLLSVIFEEVIHINKAQSVLFFGTLSWLLLFMFSKADLDYHRGENH